MKTSLSSVLICSPLFFCSIRSETVYNILHSLEYKELLFQIHPTLLLSLCMLFRLSAGHGATALNEKDFTVTNHLYLKMASR